MEQNIEHKNEERDNHQPVKNKLKENTNLMMFVYGVAGFIGLFILIFAVFGIVRVYAQGATDKATGAVSTVLRLPLAKINGHVIRYSEYLNDLKAIHTLNEYEKEFGGLTVSLNNEQMSDQVIWRLVNNIIITDLAKMYNITVSQEEIMDLQNQMIEQFNTLEEAEGELMKRYGWTLAIYEKKVIRPFILQRKIAEKFETDPGMHREVNEKAEQVLKEVLAGADFEEMAIQHGEDGTAMYGGDLGWFGKGEMVPQFEVAAFELEEGEISTELIETPFGYHIIKVDNKATEKEKDPATGKNIDVERVSARHIVFLFPSLESSLDRALKNAQASWYVKKVHNPLSEL